MLKSDDGDDTDDKVEDDGKKRILKTDDGVRLTVKMTKKRRRKICRLNRGGKVVRSEEEKKRRNKQPFTRTHLHSKNMSGDSDADSS